MELKGIGGSVGNTVRINDSENFFFFFNGCIFQYRYVQFLSMENNIRQIEVETFITELNNRLGKMDQLLKEINLYPKISGIFCRSALFLAVLSVMFLAISHDMIIHSFSNHLLKVVAFLLTTCSFLTFGINFSLSLSYSQSQTKFFQQQK